jgi:hypothetical protein
MPMNIYKTNQPRNYDKSVHEVNFVYRILLEGSTRYLASKGWRYSFRAKMNKSSGSRDEWIACLDELGEQISERE